MTSPQPHRPGAQQGSATDAVPADAPAAEDSAFEDEVAEDGAIEDRELGGGRDTAPSSGLGEPWRFALAGAELLVVVGLVLLIWWAWGRGTVLVDVSGPVGASGEQGAVQQVTRSAGNWQAASIAAAAAAGLVLLDLCRQLWLAPRPRRGR